MIEAIRDSQYWIAGDVIPLNKTSCVIHGETSRRVKWGLTAEACHFIQREALWLQRLNKLLGKHWSHNCIALQRIGPVQVLFTNYLPGRSLAELKASLSVTQRLSLVDEIFPVLQTRLAELQQHAIVHGDIKLANIILDDSKQLSLIDFANARRVGESFLGTGFMQQTPSYVAAQSSEVASFARDEYAVQQCLNNWLLEPTQNVSSKRNENGSEELR